MSNLKHTTIHRKGNSERYDKFEKQTSDDIKFNIGFDFGNELESPPLTISFTIIGSYNHKSNYEVKIGREDLPAILREIVSCIPESREAFLDCAKIIAEKNPESLTAFLECSTIAHNGKIKQEIEQEKKNTAL